MMSGTNGTQEATGHERECKYSKTNHKVESGGSERCSTMGWEQRGNKKYYYRKRREGDRVVSEYVGSGPLAELASTLDNLTRQEQSLQREQMQREREAIRALDTEVEDVCTVIRVLTYGALLAAGYHTHKGQWRKKRND